MKTVVIQGQSLLDIAIQVYGSIEGVFALAVENGLNVTDSLSPGKKLEYNPVTIADSSIAQYYRRNNLHPTTAISISAEYDGIFDDTFDLTFE